MYEIPPQEEAREKMNRMATLLMGMCAWGIKFSEPPKLKYFSFEPGEKIVDPAKEAMLARARARKKRRKVSK
jgi:hypothetical protein